MEVVFQREISTASHRLFHVSPARCLCHRLRPWVWSVPHAAHSTDMIDQYYGRPVCKQYQNREVDFKNLEYNFH